MTEKGALSHQAKEVEHQRQCMLHHGRRFTHIDMPFDPFHEGTRLPPPDEIRRLGIEAQNFGRVIQPLVEPGLAHIAPDTDQMGAGDAKRFPLLRFDDIQYADFASVRASSAASG